MKKITAILLSLCLVVAVFTACGQEEEIIENDTAVVGTWSEEYFDSGYIFNEDLTGTDTFWDLTFTYTAYDGTITITYDDEIWGSVAYTYTVTGDTLTMTRESTEEGEEPTSYSYTKEGAAQAGTDEAVTDESGETAAADTDTTAAADTTAATEAATE